MDEADHHQLTQAVRGAFRQPGLDPVTGDHGVQDEHPSRQHQVCPPRPAPMTPSALTNKLPIPTTLQPGLRPPRRRCQAAVLSRRRRPELAALTFSDSPTSGHSLIHNCKLPGQSRAFAIGGRRATGQSPEGASQFHLRLPLPCQWEGKDLLRGGLFAEPASIAPAEVASC